MREVIAAECAPGTTGPYVQGVDLSSMVLTSGQVPMCPQTGEVAESVSDQARQNLENVKAVVESAGLKVNDIMKATIFVSGLNDFATINQVYQQFFDERKAIYPTHNCVQVAHLPEDMKLEIEAIAVRGDMLQSLAG